MTIVYIINNLGTSTMTVNIVSTQQFAIPIEVKIASLLSACTFLYAMSRNEG